MSNDSNMRANSNFDDLNLLSQNLNEDYNGTLYGELCFSRYAMDKILKLYCGLSNTFKIHALFEHGVIITDYVGGAFRAHECLPSIVSSKYRVDVLKKQKDYHGAFAIGPYIHYCDSLLEDNQFKEEKNRLGKNLLVFPSHSVDGNISKFDYESFLNNIKKYSDDFDSVRVCMYYKDVQLGRHEIYQKNGFEVVTAGHIFDYNFLPRLKSIIELSDMTMSNNVGTHLGYCIYLNKPHFIDLSQNVEYVKEKNDRESKLIDETTKQVINIMDTNDNVLLIKNLFSNFDKKINKDQYELVSYLWGFDEVKSPIELKSIFFEIDENFSWLKYYISGLKRLKNIAFEGR